MLAVSNTSAGFEAIESAIEASPVGVHCLDELLGNGLLSEGKNVDGSSKCA
jgi:hypothetical protein